MSDYEKLAKEARIAVLTMIHRAGTSHIASNFSVIDIATVLYENLKPEDEVVWSAGWKAATIYYFLSKQGKIPKADLDKFPNPPYLGLAEPSVNGVLVAGGSMGHGLPIAVGMALARKRENKKGTIYCIISDGELNEGTTWESAAVAAHNKLDNLVIFCDRNGWQAMGKTNEVLIIKEKSWKGFGWIKRVIDGHDFESIQSSIKQRYRYVHENGKPLIIICNTIKGKGVSFMENHLLFHYKHVDDNEYQDAMRELQ